MGISKAEREKRKKRANEIARTYIAAGQPVVISEIATRVGSRPGNVIKWLKEAGLEEGRDYNRLRASHSMGADPSAIG